MIAISKERLAALEKRGAKVRRRKPAPAPIPEKPKAEAPRQVAPALPVSPTPSTGSNFSVELKPAIDLMKQSTLASAEVVQQVRELVAAHAKIAERPPAAYKFTIKRGPNNLMTEIDATPVEVNS